MKEKDSERFAVDQFQTDCTICYTMTEKQPMTEALKSAIESCGLSFKALERETGVTRQSLMAFMKGERTLRLDIADRVANYFGLIVGPEPKPKQKGK